MRNADKLFERAMVIIGTRLSSQRRESLYAALIELHDAAIEAARDESNLERQSALERTATRFRAQAKAMVTFEVSS